jgi:hypothetical protein
MDATTAMTMLSGFFNRSRDEDMRTREVFAALDILGKMVNVDWPFRQSGRHWTSDNEEGRWQLLNVSFNAIKLAVLNKLSRQNRH